MTRATTIGKCETEDLLGGDLQSRGTLKIFQEAHAVASVC